MWDSNAQDEDYDIMFFFEEEEYPRREVRDEDEEPLTPLHPLLPLRSSSPSSGSSNESSSTNANEASIEATSQTTSSSKRTPRTRDLEELYKNMSSIISNGGEMIVNLEASDSSSSTQSLYALIKNSACASLLNRVLPQANVNWGHKYMQITKGYGSGRSNPRRKLLCHLIRLQSSFEVEKLIGIFHGLKLLCRSQTFKVN